MEIKRCKKESFVVIGKEGSTADGQGFIQNLWKNATENYSEIEELSKKDAEGTCVGFWGAMSNLERTFQPWEDNFSKGLYLAGAECKDDAVAPDGWTKWVIPGYEYLYVESEGLDTFPKMIQYLSENNIALVGAVHDFTCPKSKKNYMFFPIAKI